MHLDTFTQIHLKLLTIYKKQFQYIISDKQCSFSLQMFMFYKVNFLRIE